MCRFVAGLVVGIFVANVLGYVDTALFLDRFSREAEAYVRNVTRTER